MSNFHAKNTVKHRKKRQKDKWLQFHACTGGGGLHCEFRKRQFVHIFFHYFGAFTPPSSQQGDGSKVQTNRVTNKRAFLRISFSRHSLLFLRGGVCSSWNSKVPSAIPPPFFGLSNFWHWACKVSAWRASRRGLPPSPLSDCMLLL